jgi:hypothetical protein
LYWEIAEITPIWTNIVLKPKLAPQNHQSWLKKQYFLILDIFWEPTAQNFWHSAEAQFPSFR